MNQTPNQTVSISTTPFFFYLWGAARENPCAACASPRHPSHCTWLWYNTQELCWAVEQQNWAHGLRGQPSFSQGLPARSRRWTLEWDCNYSWSKIYCGHWFCSMKYLQETSTDSLTWLKINWSVFRFFGMEWECSRSASHMNDLFCFLLFWFFSSLNPLFQTLGLSFTVCFFSFTTLWLSVPPPQPLLIFFFFLAYLSLRKDVVLK